MTDDHGSCPHCGVDLNGGSIWETGVKMAFEGNDGAGLEKGPAKTQEEAEKRADKYASLYGATRKKGKWGRQIGISNWDRVVEWQCPDCGSAAQPEQDA